MSSRRKGCGRQKIDMKKMNNKSNLQVTFSKRCSGLFKKASELSTLCCAEIALVVFSPDEKVFSFGHPTVDIVIDRYLSRVPPQDNDIMQFIEAHRSVNVRELNTQLTQINNTLDGEKKFCDELSHLRKVTEAQFWWACPIYGMNRNQLELLKNSLEELKKLVAHHADKLMVQGPPTQTIPFFLGNVLTSNISHHHQAPPPRAQMFPPHVFQNPIMQPHLFHDFNNIGGGEGYEPSAFSCSYYLSP